MVWRENPVSLTFGNSLDSGTGGSALCLNTGQIDRVKNMIRRMSGTICLQPSILEFNHLNSLGAVS